MSERRQIKACSDHAFLTFGRHHYTVAAGRCIYGIHHRESSLGLPTNRQAGATNRRPFFFRRKEAGGRVLLSLFLLSLFLLSPYSFLLTFEQEVPWILDVFLDPDKELHRLAAVDDAVVVAERHVHHRADGNLPVDGHGAVLDLVQAQDAHLRRVQDWGAEE